MDSSSTDPRTAPIDVRPTRAEDLGQIDRLLARVNFDSGEHILRLYFENSDQEWQVATNCRGEIVAFDACHILEFERTSFGYLMYVADEYRNRGVIRLFGSVYAIRPGISNVAPQAMKLFPQMERYDSKLLGYSGQPHLHLLRVPADGSDGESSAITIRLVRTEGDIRKVVAYDHESVYLQDRERFVRAWCTESKPDEPYARTVMAERDGRTVGFGVIRRFTDFYALQPLYADDPVVAETLLAELVRSFVEECGREELYVFFEATNYTMMRFVKEQQFEQCDCEMRQYGQGAIAIKELCRFDRVYSMTDYWPV